MFADELGLVHTRPATDSDTDFLWDVQRRALGEYVREQFGTTDQQQRQYFDRHFDVARHLVVERDDEPIGFLFHEQRGDLIYLGNLALLPEYQGAGVGTELVRSVLAGAAVADLPVTLQVLRSNHAAKRFYEGLGFVESGMTSSHILMIYLHPRGN